ncbi:hypothetical protein PR048_025546 [Dryococelus australis]|uniref:Uncharacterized protein n=1 Tax=Dryococelus australis TaxID=614101 RepID=A0ABQ9GRP8_9NEOP|nr:hypothetical protein PR048_025546 [Dryococelus australis]
MHEGRQACVWWSIWQRPKPTWDEPVNRLCGRFSATVEQSDCFEQFFRRSAAGKRVSRMVHIQENTIDLNGSSRRHHATSAYIGETVPDIHAVGYGRGLHEKGSRSTALKYAVVPVACNSGRVSHISQVFEQHNGDHNHGHITRALVDTAPGYMFVQPEMVFSSDVQQYLSVVQLTKYDSIGSTRGTMCLCIWLCDLEYHMTAFVVNGLHKAMVLEQP